MIYKRNLALNESLNNGRYDDLTEIHSLDDRDAAIKCKELIAVYAACARVKYSKYLDTRNISNTLEDFFENINDQLREYCNSQTLIGIVPSSIISDIFEKSTDIKETRDILGYGVILTEEKDKLRKIPNIDRKLLNLLLSALNSGKNIVIV